MSERKPGIGEKRAALGFALGAIPCLCGAPVPPAAETLVFRAPESEAREAKSEAGEGKSRTCNGESETRDGSTAERPSTPTAGKNTVVLEQTPASAFLPRCGGRATDVEIDGNGVELRKDEVLVTRTKGAPRVVSEAEKRAADGTKREPPAPTDETTNGEETDARVFSEVEEAEESTRVELPYRMRFIDEQGRPRTSLLVAEVAGGGFRITPEGRSFAAQVYVTLMDAEEPAARYDLPQPVQVLVTGEVDRVSPHLFELERTNAWSTIGLEASTVSERVPVKIRPAIDPVGLVLRLDVIRPHLDVTLSSSSIQGFGLESADVVVRAEGLPNPAGQVVVLSADRGRLSKTELVLDEHGVAMTELRSSGTGMVRVVAYGPAASSGKEQIWFQWPLRFLLAATIGGVIGALAGELRRGGLRGKPSNRVALDVLGGVLLGFVVTVAYAAGVSLLALEIPRTGGEALVFTIAALGALGIALKVKLPNLTGGGDLSAGERHGPSPS